ncbi:MAG: RNA polymerase sigma factor [Gammaproteobacteria bacterium]
MSAERTETTLAPAAPDTPGPARASDRAEAISALFREHNRALVQFLLTRLPNEAEAKEVAQEAYVRLLQLDQPVAASFLRWYLFKIAKGIAIDHYRQRVVRERLDRLDLFDDLDVSSPTESSVMASDELALLLSALRELPRKCQQAFLLQRFRDLSTLEVAAIMGLTDRMVRRYVKRALIYCRLRIEGLSREEAMRQVEP